MRRRWRDSRQDTEQLDITAFMNLMVVLVPFLLITAVFSRLAVHELDVAARAASAAEPPPLELELILRDGRIDVADRNTGLLQSFAGTELETLHGYIRALKMQFPEVTSATLLVEPAIAYERVIEVMDRVRVTPGADGWDPLFPHVSVGDAPPPYTLASGAEGG